MPNSEKQSQVILLSSVHTVYGDWLACVTNPPVVKWWTDFTLGSLNFKVASNRKSKGFPSAETPLQQHRITVTVLGEQNTDAIQESLRCKHTQTTQTQSTDLFMSAPVQGLARSLLTGLKCCWCLLLTSLDKHTHTAGSPGNKSLITPAAIFLQVSIHP